MATSALELAITLNRPWKLDSPALWSSFRRFPRRRNAHVRQIWPHHATRWKKPHVALPVARGLSQSFGAPHRYRSTPTCWSANSREGESRLLERVPCSSTRLIRLIRLIQWLRGETGTTLVANPQNGDVIVVPASPRDGIVTATAPQIWSCHAVDGQRDSILSRISQTNWRQEPREGYHHIDPSVPKLRGRLLHPFCFPSFSLSVTKILGTLFLWVVSGSVI